ncbi:MAG: type I methionyl aminopeptidase [Candidatus Saganbacteria bacterium]|nr:type I methionyl aminopeptidase [Candidatus Saganbacteria bacterium]
MIKIKTEEEIKLIRLACRVAEEVLKTAEKNVAPGITTRELDNIIETEIIKRGAKPAFKGYRGYRHASCLSVNEEIVHGIPSDRLLMEGDIIGVDIGAIVGGYYGDVAETFPVGKISKAARKLLSTASECLDLGIKTARYGKKVGDISSSIEQHAKRHGYSVVKDLFGHGVGSELHEDPLIPNFGSPGTGPKLEKGMVFAIEPMLNIGTSEIETLDDGWTVVTKDRKLSAHFEHTILITEDKAEILTRI